MSATSCLLSEEQFLCCICLEVFTDPVTIPCGHNFCKNCITQHWNINSVQCRCPMCKRHFEKPPELRVNTFISEMAENFRQSSGNQDSTSLEKQIARPGDIPCDICSGRKLKALKSCLTCFASYCGFHLEPHLTADPLKRHSLLDPIVNIEGRVCAQHKKPLELFCRTDQTCVCCLCTVSEHAAHNIVSLNDEYKAKCAELELTEAQIRKRVQDRQLKIQQFQRLRINSREDAEREFTDGVKIFTFLMQNAERGLNKLIERIEEKQKTTEAQATHSIRELEQDISALTTKTTELQQLLHNQDHFLFLQIFTSMNTDACLKDWSEVSFQAPSYEGTVVKALDELEEKLSSEKQLLLHEARLRSFRFYAVDVLLEPHTANPWLILSDDHKQVRCGEVKTDLPDNIERFSTTAAVLSQQSFSTGRFYYVVQVTGKTDWILGVVKRSVDRKGIIPVSPVNGYWSVGLRNGNEYYTLTSPAVSLSLNTGPERVGVFVSYEEGLVSFYDIDAAVHLYSFTDCCFTEELLPFFSPGLLHGGMNSAPLTILPVKHTE